MIEPLALKFRKVIKFPMHLAFNRNFNWTVLQQIHVPNIFKMAYQKFVALMVVVLCQLPCMTIFGDFWARTNTWPLMIRRKLQEPPKKSFTTTVIAQQP